jgi:hypothetical protein
VENSGALYERASDHGGRRRRREENAEAIGGGTVPCLPSLANESSSGFGNAAGKGRVTASSPKSNSPLAAPRAGSQSRHLATI